MRAVLRPRSRFNDHSAAIGLSNVIGSFLFGHLGEICIPHSLVTAAQIMSVLTPVTTLRFAASIARCGWASCRW